MSIQVKQFDENKAKEELKKCPLIVRQYVKLLQEHLESTNTISKKAISKLMELANDRR